MDNSSINHESDYLTIIPDDVLFVICSTMPFVLLDVCKSLDDKVSKYYDRLGINKSGQRLLYSMNKIINTNIPKDPPLTVYFKDKKCMQNVKQLLFKNNFGVNGMIILAYKQSLNFYIQNKLIPPKCSYTRINYYIRMLIGTNILHIREQLVGNKNEDDAMAFELRRFIVTTYNIFKNICGSPARFKLADNCSKATVTVNKEYVFTLEGYYSDLNTERHILS